MDFLQLSELTGHHFTDVFLTLQKFFCLRQLKMLNVYQPVAGYNTILGYKILYIENLWSLKFLKINVYTDLKLNLTTRKFDVF